jgi:hypothetical protein
MPAQWQSKRAHCAVHATARACRCTPTRMRQPLQLQERNKFSSRWVHFIVRCSVARTVPPVCPGHHGVAQVQPPASDSCQRYYRAHLFCDTEETGDCPARAHRPGVGPGGPRMPEHPRRTDCAYVKTCAAGSASAIPLYSRSSRTLCTGAAVRMLRDFESESRS